MDRYYIFGEGIDIAEDRVNNIISSFNSLLSEGKLLKKVNKIRYTYEKNRIIIETLIPQEIFSYDIRGRRGTLIMNAQEFEKYGNSEDLFAFNISVLNLDN